MKKAELLEDWDEICASVKKVLEMLGHDIEIVSSGGTEKEREDDDGENKDRLG